MRNHAGTALLAATTLWCLAILVTPVAELPLVYEFFARICHQDPVRSWHLMGKSLPVCIRCVSIYFGFLAALVFQLPAERKWLVRALGLGVAEIILARMVMDSPTLRSLTGLAAGAAAAPFVKRGVEEMWRNRRVSV